MTDLSAEQTKALRELARGPLRSYPGDRWARNGGAPTFGYATLLALATDGYVRMGELSARLTPAGLDAARLRGFLPQLAKVRPADSLLPPGGSQA